MDPNQERRNIPKSRLPAKTTNSYDLLQVDKRTPRTLVPNEFLTQGAKLQALDQATAYQGIRQIKSAKEPPIAAELIDQTRAAIEQYCGERETDETIWTSLRKPTLRIRVQQFRASAIGSTARHVTTSTQWSTSSPAAQLTQER